MATFRPRDLVRPRAASKRSPGKAARAGGPNAGSPFWRASTSGRAFSADAPTRGAGKCCPLTSAWGGGGQGARLASPALRRHDPGQDAVKADFAKLRKTLSQQAIFTAKLLAGDMPREIEGLFVQARLSLFPEKLDDLGTECSCPDWSNPCKHIAAVYYLLGEEFDRDPFLIFKLRGLSREKLIAILGDEALKPSAPGPPAAGGGDESRATSRPEPLSPAVAQFWQGTELPAGWLGEIQPPPLTAAPGEAIGQIPLLARKSEVPRSVGADLHLRHPARPGGASEVTRPASRINRRGS